MRRSRFAAYVGSLLLALAAVLTGTGTAHAAEGPYVALGDSYSSGVGAGSYLSSSGDCKRSTKAYPYLWAAAHSPSSFAFTACSGARTGDVLASQLTPLNAATALVSISIGGNDAGLLRRHDDLCAPVRQLLPGPDQHREGVRRRHAPGPTGQRLLGDHVPGPQRPRGRPRLPPLLQARHHLPRPLRDQAEGDQRRRRLPRHRHRQAGREPRLRLGRRPWHLHRPRTVLRQRLAAQSQPAQHRRVLPPDRGSTSPAATSRS